MRPLASEAQALSKPERISPFIRTVSGLIGVLGFVAIALNALQDGGIEPGVVIFASFFAGFIFLFVAFFGKYPWGRSETDE